jgi:hypothetical protein
MDPGSGSGAKAVGPAEHADACHCAEDGQDGSGRADQGVRYRHLVEADEPAALRQSKVKQKWVCRGCSKEASSRGGIEEDGGKYFVVCNQCGAKNEIVRTEGGAGSPIEFTILGLKKD